MNAPSSSSASLVNTEAAVSVARRFGTTYRLAIAIGAVCLIAAVPLVVKHAGHADSASVAAVPPAAPPAMPPNASLAPPMAAVPAPPRVCMDCGEVFNVRTARTEGESSGVGAVAGGALGGILGHQIGAGRGKEAMTVLGAIGGVVGGNQVEKQVKAKTLYLVDVRMADGSVRTITETAPPSLAIGAKVRVEGTTIALR